MRLHWGQVIPTSVGTSCLAQNGLDPRSSLFHGDILQRFGVLHDLERHLAIFGELILGCHHYENSSIARSHDVRLVTTLFDEKFEIVGPIQFAWNHRNVLYMLCHVLQMV